MHPGLAALVVGAIVAAATVAGLVLRARSGRLQRRTRVDRVTAADLGLQRIEATTLVQFSTEFCARCPNVRRGLERLATLHDGVAYVDVDLTDRPDLARRYRVLQTPTVLVVEPGGRVRSRFSGQVAPQSVEAQLVPAP